MVRFVCYSPDGKYLATSSEDKTCKVWDASTLKLIFEFAGHTSDVSHVSFSPDSQYLVSSSHDHSVILWNLSTGKAQFKLAAHTNLVTNTVFSPDGKHLVSSSYDRTAKIWDALNGNLIQTLTLDIALNWLAYSNDGKYIAIAHGSLCSVWDACTLKQVHLLSSHGKEVKTVIFSHDSRTIATGSEDMTIKLWDSSSGKLIQTLPGHKSDVNCIAFSPDGRYLVSGSDYGDQTCKIWETYIEKPYQLLQGHDAGITKVVFSPDGKYLASSSKDKKCKVWNVKTTREILRLNGHSNEVSGIAYSSDGKYIATCSKDMTAILWNAASGKIVRKFEGNSSGILSVEFSPDNNHILAVFENKTFKIFETFTSKVLYTSKEFSANISNAKFSPDQKNLVVSYGENISVYEHPTMTETKTIHAHPQAEGLGCMGFSLDGKFLITTGLMDMRGYIWDFSSLRILQKIYLKNGVKSFAYSHDGKYLATGGYMVKSQGTYYVHLWNILSGMHDIVNLKAHIDTINCVNFSPDGKHLATCSDDKFIKLWENCELDDFEIENTTSQIFRTRTQIGIFESGFEASNAFLDNCKISKRYKEIFSQRGSRFGKDQEKVYEMEDNVADISKVLVSKSDPERFDFILQATKEYLLNNLKDESNVTKNDILLVAISA